MKSYIRKDYTRNMQLSTFEIQSPQLRDLYIQNPELYMLTDSKEDDHVSEFRNMMQSTISGLLCRWFITYAGNQPAHPSEFDVSKVYVISVFWKDHGWRLFRIARKSVPQDGEPVHHLKLKQDLSAAIRQHIEYVSKIGWAEVKQDLASTFYEVLGYKEIIDPYDLKDHNVFSYIDIDPWNEIHYWRSAFRCDDEYHTSYGAIVLNRY